MKANGIVHASDRAIEISARRSAERATRAGRDADDDPVDRWTRHAGKLTGEADEGIRIETLPRRDPPLTPVTGRVVTLPPTPEPTDEGPVAVDAQTGEPATDTTASSDEGAGTAVDAGPTTAGTADAGAADAARYARTEPFARALLDRVDGRLGELSGSPLFAGEQLAQVDALREDLANTLAALDPSNRGDMRQAARAAMHTFRAGMNAVVLDAHRSRVDERVDRFLASHEVDDDTRATVDALRAQYQQDLSALRDDVLAPEGLSRHEMRVEFKALSERLLHAVRDAVLHPERVETQPAPTPTVDPEPPMVEDSGTPTPVDPLPADPADTSTTATDETTGTDGSQTTGTTDPGTTTATDSTPATIAALGAELTASLQSLTTLVHDALDRLVALSPTSLELSFSLSVGPSGALASFAAAYKGAGTTTTPTVTRTA